MKATLPTSEDLREIKVKERKIMETELRLIPKNNSKDTKNQKVLY